MTTKELKYHESQSFDIAYSPITLHKTYDHALFLGDKRTHALFDERKDLDINCHGGAYSRLGLPVGSVVIDIGAYIGDSVTGFLRNGAIVHAFEPFLDTFLCLIYNTRGQKCTCYNFALGNGEIIKLDHTYDGDDGGSRYVKESRDGIKTVRLDDIQFEIVDFIKIDCEGREPSVLLGATETIKKHRPIMLIESYPDGLSRQGFCVKQLTDYIKSLGYILKDSEGNEEIDTEYTSVRDLYCWPIKS